MVRLLHLILLLSTTGEVFSQQSDFIVIKKRNNRTLKTYASGSFISAVTYNGFAINGFIKDIRNDTIFIQQQETRLVGTEFGSTLDTINYTITVDYREIKKFNYTKNYVWGHKKGFASVTLPAIMIIGGTGFIVLELVNTAYRHESLNDGNKLASLGIAAGIAATGFLIKGIQTHSDKVGGKYKVVYMHMKK
ncbi:MAG TPA: hypothetical protein VFV68_17855 [Agriterribacter sp.]|nr:hypothetical protein [Agriterribacter sp.]